MKLIALGDNVIDYYHNTQECFPGGNAVNVAVHAARLGAQAEYLGSLGDDKMAHIVEKALQENGRWTSAIAPVFARGVPPRCAAMMWSTASAASLR